MKIGKRESVGNLQGIWAKETDFSDWLVTEDGLQLIAEDLGVEIEDPRREHRPGDFRCDIVGHLVGDENHVVVIENQFGKTDHDHLGKLLTYASMNTAATAIWISEAVSDDHRTVIDWLNANTPPQISFYLAQVKAYRIGDSPVAPQLDVVSRPNFEVKVQREASSAADKERHIWRKEFWQEILPYIQSQKPLFNVQSPSTDHGSSIALGRSHFNLALLLIPRRQCIGIEVFIGPAWKDAAFAQLHEQRADIEREIGSLLQWQPRPGKKSAGIVLEAEIDPRQPENRQAVKEWLHQQAVAFHKAFKPRVAQLKATLTALSDNHDEEHEESSASHNDF